MVIHECSIEEEDSCGEVGGRGVGAAGEGDASSLRAKMIDFEESG